jgi:hypothetical protein
MYGQHAPRKPKISPSRQEGVGLTGGAMISTGPSHNGSSSKQLIKIINSGRDRGASIRKGKGPKVLVQMILPVFLFIFHWSIAGTATCYHGC